MDWSAGNYELIAAQLLPAARACVECAAPRAGEHVVDVACGTGNAALLAAESGARVTGIEPAERLLDVAAEHARARGLEVTFARGEAASLPLPDACADVVLSVFGVIFASDAQDAGNELARISAQGGRIVLCAWIPAGALFEVTRMRREVVAFATGLAPGPPPFAWHDADSLRALFAPLGFSIGLREERLAASAGSALEFVESEFRDHPLWVAARALLEPRREMKAMRDRVLEILTEANEDPEGFRITSSYVVAMLHRA